MGVRFTRRLRALAGREPSQECFAPKAASPRLGGELRLPFAAEQTPLGGGGSFGTGPLGMREDQAVGPPAALQGTPPPGLQTCWWLLSCCVGQAGWFRILTGGGDGTLWLGRWSAPGLGWGRRGNSVLNPCT